MTLDTAPFPIYNADGTYFHNLVLHKATFNSTVMALSDKITGDVFYPTNTLAVTMNEYIEYDGTHYILVNPPTVVREGKVADNGELKGMTKYSFEFFHPMYVLSNLPFSDVAVSVDEKRYLSESKTFYWVGYIADFVNKLNKNLDGTEWVAGLDSNVPSDVLTQISDVLSFDNVFVADAIKTAYDTWKVPFIISTIRLGETHYSDGKRFLIQFGQPSQEIYASAEDEQNNTPFVFQIGKGLGLSNNSATPKNNKIVTRIVGYGSEDNIPYGYPQIIWYGNQEWTNTENSADNSRGYPIYDGIVGGAPVKLIKHPFTRNHLMPSVFITSLFNKVSPYLSDGTSNPDYDPDTTLIDYYDALDPSVYPHVINTDAPSVEIHTFEGIKPEFDANREKFLYAAWPDKAITIKPSYLTRGEFEAQLIEYMNEAQSAEEEAMFDDIIADWYDCCADFDEGVDKETWTGESASGATYIYSYTIKLDGYLTYFNLVDERGDIQPVVVMDDVDNIPAAWNDNIDEDGNFQQSYFNVTLPILGFDLYACAAITQEMKINMRSGACIGCTFTIQCDWDDYKKNFYDNEGNFLPNGSQRNYTKYPDSTGQRIDVIVQKDNETFGIIMPNIYQQPKSGDLFTILGISLPQSYVNGAQQRLDAEMASYMLKNNVYYFEYPLKFDEHFLATHTYILSQIHNNSVLRFMYAGNQYNLFVKQITAKYGENVLPQYDITLTDEIEVVLNAIGRTVESVNLISREVEHVKGDYESTKAKFESELGALTRYSEMSVYVQRAFSQSTDIYGGLILTSLIALRDENGDIQSGISGLCYNGTDIAAWFGGPKIDKEATYQTPQTNYAKSLFRFDGSGYVAGGNISWDVYGNTKIAGLIKKESGYEYPDGTTTNDLPLGVLTTALTPSSDRTIEAKNATIKNLKLERALVSGFVLRDYFDITPDNFRTLPRIGVNALNVYDLGTVIRVKGTADEWDTILGGGNLVIFLPYVPATDYDEWPNNSQQNLESISAKKQTIYDQCRNLDGQVVSFCNLSEISFVLVAEGSSQYVSANICTVVPNHSTTLKMTLGVGYLSIHTTERAEVLTWEFVNDSNIWTASDTP